MSDTIYFDASCGVCSAGVQRTQRMLQSRGFIYEPLQSPGVAEMFGFPQGEVPEEMKLRTANGELLGGAEAIVYICRRIWWPWPIWLVSKLPGAMPILRIGYRLFARNRYRISQGCRI